MVKSTYSLFFLCRVLSLGLRMKYVHSARNSCSGFIRNHTFTDHTFKSSSFRIQIRSENNPPVCVQRCFEYGSKCAGVLVNEDLHQCWLIKCFLNERYLERGLLMVSSGWRYYLDVNKCRKDWIPYNGHCYLFVNVVKDSWFGSVSRCNKLGSYLVEIDDEGENMWLTSTFPIELDGQKNYEKAVMIGASSVLETGPYVWNHSGLPLVYQRWNPGEPSSHDSENCATLMANGFWNNIKCQTQKHFVCEQN